MVAARHTPRSCAAVSPPCVVPAHAAGACFSRQGVLWVLFRNCGTWKPGLPPVASGTDSTHGESIAQTMIDCNTGQLILSQKRNRAMFTGCFECATGIWHTIGTLGLQNRRSSGVQRGVPWHNGRGDFDPLSACSVCHGVCHGAPGDILKGAGWNLWHTRKGQFGLVFVGKCAKSVPRGQRKRTYIAVSPYKSMAAPRGFEPL